MPQPSTTFQPTPPRPTARQVLPVVFLTILLDLLGFGLVIPIAPFYAQQFGMRPWQITLLAAAFSLMQYFFMPVWGRLSDRIGRRPVILWSVAASCVGYLAFGLATAAWMLFAARLVSGIGNANIGAAQAVIADTTEPHERARGMGMIGAAFGIGFILGPVFGGILGKIDLALPAYVAAGLGAINWVLAYVRMPETLDRTRVHPQAELAERKDSAELRVLKQQPNVVRLLLVSLIVTIGFAMMEQITGLFVQHFWVPVPVNASPALRGELNKHAAVLATAILAAVGVVMVAIQGGLIGRLTRKFGEPRLLRVGTATITLGLLLMVGAGTIGWYPGMFVASVVLAAGSALNMPSLTSLLSRSAPPEHQGGLLGTGQSRAALGRVLGPAMAGGLFELEPRLPLLVGACLALVAFVLSLGVRLPNLGAQTPGLPPTD